MQRVTARTNRKDFARAKGLWQKEREYVHMTRDELRGIVEGISDEQLKKILDINSSDIGKAKKQTEELERQLEERAERMNEMESRIAEFEKNQHEADEIRKRADELQKVVDERNAADKAELLKQEFCRRFDAVTEGAMFVNDFTREGIFEQFKEAVGDEKNIGKADSEIYGQLIEGRDNIFIPDGGLPSVVASTTGFGGLISDGDVREIMGLAN